MHEVLFLLALIKNQYDVRIQSEVDESAETTRKAQRGEFNVPKSRLRKTDDNFFDEPKYCSTTSCKFTRTTERSWTKLHWKESDIVSLKNSST